MRRPILAALLATLLAAPAAATDQPPPHEPLPPGQVINPPAFAPAPTPYDQLWQLQEVVPDLQPVRPRPEAALRGAGYCAEYRTAIGEAVSRWEWIIEINGLGYGGALSDADQRDMRRFVKSQRDRVERPISDARARGDAGTCERLAGGAIRAMEAGIRTAFGGVPIRLEQ